MKIGALSLGLLGFAIGVSVCIHYKLPIPPIFVTEIGVMFGAGLGAFVGWCWPVPVRRLSLAGLVAGFLAGLLWCGLRWHWEPLAWMGFIMAGGFLGHQAALHPRRTGDPWRLYR